MTGVVNSKDFISERMSADIERLSKHFNVTDDLFGKSIFLKHLIKQNGDAEDTEQKLLIQEILDVYISILSNMKSRTEDNDIKSSIIHIMDRVKKLKNQVDQQREHLLKRQLQDLWAVQTSDSVVQSKAIRELITVFQKASELGIQT
ncbi:interferon gamma-related-like [Paramormyrops kingsleyae]|uniref:interferon gamma-related-like n=1 Tax=Paramormyrops kingsleyae TaxID=1676925 RepID=UPI003B97937C